MPGQYDNDFNRMQQEAIERVREMQKRARYSVERSNEELFSRSEEVPSRPEPPKEKIKPPVKPRAHAPPVRPPRSNPLEGLLSGKGFNLQSILGFNLESDHLLILGLLFLLYTDSGDRLLMLALLYIML